MQTFSLTKAVESHDIGPGLQRCEGRLLWRMRSSFVDSANAHQGFATLADVFSLGNSKRHEFKPILRSVVVAHAGRKMKGVRSQRDLQMYGVTDFQLGGGGHAGATFGEIDASALYVYGRFSFCDTDPDTLMELKSRETALWRSRHVLQSAPWLGSRIEGDYPASYSHLVPSCMITCGHVHKDIYAKGTDACAPG